MHLCGNSAALFPSTYAYMGSSCTSLQVRQHVTTVKKKKQISVFTGAGRVTGSVLRL